MPRNPWSRFRQLTAGPPLLVGEVTAHNTDGTSTIQTPDGGTLRVQGQGVAVGNNAYYRDGRIEGDAPSLSVIEVTV